MKNCEEMVESLFVRREQYRHKQKVRRKVMVGFATAAVCCLCAVTVWGISGEYEDATEQPSVQMETPIVTEPPETRLVYEIVVNPIEKISTERMGIALMWDDFVEMTQEEMKEYYGMDYIPNVPEDLKALEHWHGVFKRNRGTGEIYWDEDELRYFNADKSRDLSIRVAKGKLPYVFCNPFKGTEEMSKINGVEITIGMDDHGCYYTEFVYKDVGFMIFADGLTETEFVNIIASVLDS